MAVKKPYYPEHQIDTGKYARPNEFVFSDGSDYTGPFHTLPNDTHWTGFTVNDNSVQIYKKRNEASEAVKVFNRNNNREISNYISPVFSKPIISDFEKENGEVERFFVQKINNPYTTIIEIDGEQYNSINTSNRIGINGALWNSVRIIWSISGPHSATLNERRVKKAESEFKGLSNYIKNYLEFTD